VLIGHEPIKISFDIIKGKEGKEEEGSRRGKKRVKKMMNTRC
jgi:hypothetical protein